MEMPKRWQTALQCWQRLNFIILLQVRFEWSKVPPHQFPNESYSPFFSFYIKACCWCCGCCTNQHLQSRTYFQVWDNRIEYNRPTSIFNCFATSERCVDDHVRVRYFDRLPTRSTTCCLVPCSICGPPVIFASTPSILCVDLSDCCGQQIMTAPCNCYGMKSLGFCCCPCYRFWACPLVSGIKNAGEFLFFWRGAFQAYAEKHGLPAHQMASFDNVRDPHLSEGT